MMVSSEACSLTGKRETERRRGLTQKYTTHYYSCCESMICVVTSASILFTLLVTTTRRVEFAHVVYNNYSTPRRMRPGDSLSI